MNDFIDKLPIGPFYKLVLRIVAPTVMAALVKMVDDYVKKTVSTTDDLIWAQVQAFLKQLGILS